MLKQFVLITPVWGAGHIRLFLEIGLPSLMALDNIPRLAQLGHVTYLIYIKASETKLFHHVSVLEELKKTVHVSFIEIEKEFQSHHMTMNWCHKDGYHYAVQKKGYAVFLPPDCVWSNQAMLSMYHIVLKGYNLIHMSGVRVISELFSKAIKDNKQGVTLAPRELVKLALAYLHPITWSHFFDEKDGGLMPANLFWTVDETGIIARCFHLHPLLIHAEKPCDFQSTIDDDLALVFDVADDNEYIVTDSDELVAFEISSFSHKVLAAYRKGSINDVAGWATTGTNIKHRSFIRKNIKIHAENTDNPAWLITTQRADRVVNDIFEVLDSKQSVFHLSRINLLNSLRQNKLFSQALSQYHFILRKLMGASQRLLSSPRGLYPWHWNYFFQRDVCNPFIHELNDLTGNVLYFDDQYHPLIHQMTRIVSKHRNLDIHLRTIADVTKNAVTFSCVYESCYDAIIIRDFDCSLVDNKVLLDLIYAVLKPGGKFVYYTMDRIFLNKLQLPQGIVFLNEQMYGYRGTKIFLSLYRRLYKSTLLLKNAGQHYTIKHTVRLIISPLFFVVYPVVSLVTFLLNKLSKKDRAWVVKKMSFYCADRIN